MSGNVHTSLSDKGERQRPVLVMPVQGREAGTLEEMKALEQGYGNHWVITSQSTRKIDATCRVVGSFTIANKFTF